MLLLSYSLILGKWDWSRIAVGQNQEGEGFYSTFLLFSHSVVSDSATPRTAACQALLSFTISQSLLTFMSIESVMPSNNLILCCPLLLLPSIFPSIRIFSNESALSIRWPKYWSFSFSISPSNESVQLSRSVMSDSLRPHELEHARLSCPSPTSRVHPNLCPLCWQCHLIISSSVVPFSSHPQSFPASGSFQMSQLSTSGGQSIGVSASASVPPMNTQDWSPLGWTGWISLQSKGLSKVFSNTTFQKHQFF